MKKLMPIVIIAVMFHLYVPSSAFGTYDAKNLKGIKSLFVLIENLPSEAAKFRLSKEKLQADVELKLRLVGIYDKSSRDFIYVTVNLLETVGGFASSVSVYIEQFVTLEVSGEDTSVKIWSLSNLLVGPKEGAESFIRQYVKDSVDIFLNDYLKANPKNIPLN